MQDKQNKKSDRIVPAELLISWTANAIKAKQEGMLIITDGQIIFPHYEIPTFGLWDTAVALEKNGFKVLEFHIFK